MTALIKYLNKLAVQLVRRTEIIGALIIFAIVFTMILPLPTELLDVLIALNICISSLLIVLAMYLPRPLAFSTFPAVLLLTTMFRLSLSIATTRLILMEQNAGEIVEAFGVFVVGGNLAVGLVIFLIITLVNFLVITKGSERVAEVAARFSLDAMPGKQMSIDSDLRANLIGVNEARHRREQLSKESQLFGAMDGAMKFVKGDAIAGLVIVCINLVGGFAVGVLQRDMEPGDAMELYSILTVGDGLIAQIPSLLISLTAGMIITRVSADDQIESANIGGEIGAQMTSQPKAWIFSSVGMMGFAAVPGMPTLIFISMSLVCLGSGVIQMFRQRKLVELEEQVNRAREASPDQHCTEDIRRFNPSRPYVMQFHPCNKNTPEIDDLMQKLRQVRNTLVYHFGFTLPSLEYEYDAQCEEDEFRFYVYEVPLLRATFNARLTAIAAHLVVGQPDAIPGRPERDEGRWVWFENQHPIIIDHTDEAFSASQLLIERMTRAFQISGPQFIGLQESKVILGWLEAQQSELAQELQRTLPLACFASVLQCLAREMVSLRSVRKIAEALIEHGQNVRELNLLIDAVRIALKAQICHQYVREGELSVWLLTAETEVLLRDLLLRTQNEAYFSLDADMAACLFKQLHESFPERGDRTAVLLVTQDLRSPLRNLIAEDFHHVPVLSFAELLSRVQVNVLGKIHLDDVQQSDFARFAEDDVDHV
ncbi:type III secretion system export apparatus subunit SctV [Pseudomonas fluorescens]|uniref:type III secretion system export apparatus subunit SctV n=1 Tax=Pseudomonas fluorescens TaxID=294 RepID=UPI001BE8E87A|nr:type III secretion system export apparatus subunit SctV [Pseudomonas fluorescens]MBT2375467.1 type III secretion system export apparatus subunit SctV [Pseudomonas fluorescens]